MGVELRSLMAESPMVLYTATSEMTDSSRKMTHRALSPANMFSFLRMLGFVYSSLTWWMKVFASVATAPPAAVAGE